MDIQYPEDILRGRGGEVLKQFKQMKNMIGPILGIILLVAVAGTSVYTIDAEEVGVVTRFGRYVRQTEPGLHVRIPFFIEQVIPVKVRRVLTEEFGFRKDTTRRRRTGTQARQSESLMLTGDLNVLEVRWIVQYQISEPEKYLFTVRNPLEIIRDMSEAVMRGVAGDYSVDEVLTTKRSEIDVEVQQKLQAILDTYGAGVKVVTVKLQDVTPPDLVKPAFNEVNEARQEKERMINQARQAYNRAIPRARGEAQKTIREAEGYALNVVNRAKGEADRFLATWAAYREAPEVTRKRLYLDMMAEVLPGVKSKFVIDAEEKSILRLLQLQSAGGS